MYKAKVSCVLVLYLHVYIQFIPISLQLVKQKLLTYLKQSQINYNLNYKEWVVYIFSLFHIALQQKRQHALKKKTNKKQSQENTFNRHLLVTGAGFTGWACRLWEFPSTSVQGCDQEPSPLQSVNMNRIEEREHHMKVALSHTELHR